MDDAASSAVDRGWVAADQDFGLAEELAAILPPPVPIRARADGWTHERQRGFLEALASTGSVSAACAAAGMSRESAYALRRRAAGRAFAQAWDAARALAAEHLIDIAWDRATMGEVRQRFYHGEVVGEYRHYDNRLLLQLIAQNRAAAGRAVASPELVAEVASDWEAALGRVESGEALAEPVPAEAQDGIAPPLPRQTNRAGEALDEGQLLEIGLYGYWWDEEQDCWLTNWPAGEDWDGAEYARNRDGSVAGPFVPDLEEDEWGQPLPPLEERWARTLAAEEEAGLESGMDREKHARRARLELYRRAAFGLASAAERGSIAAVNSGRALQGEEG